jgi:hypothetical protein
MTLRARFAMVRNQTPPTERIGERAVSQKDWYLFFTNLYTAVTDGLPQPEEEVTIDASPAVYTAVIRGQAHIGGGNVSSVEFSRNGTDWYDTGLVDGFVEMDKADSLRITYTVLPTVTFFPM